MTDDNGDCDLSPVQRDVAVSIIEQAISLYAAAARRRAANMTVDEAVEYAVTSHENHLGDVPEHVAARAAELTDDQIDAIESGRGMNRSLASFGNSSTAPDATASDGENP